MAALLPALVPVSGQAAWQLDNNASYLSFVTTKKNSVSEVQIFTDLKARINDNHRARLVIDLNSVSTGVGIRDTRIKQHLFKTQFLPKMALDAQLPETLLSNLQPGGTLVHKLEGELSLNGFAQKVSTNVLVSKNQAGRLTVQSLQPVMVDSTEFGLDGGGEALRVLAKLSSITTKVPVSFQLSFLEDTQTTTTEPTSPSAPSNISLETSNERTTVRWQSSQDSDNDGIADSHDAYPNDKNLLGEKGASRKLIKNNAVISEDIASELSGFRNKNDYYQTQLRAYVVPPTTGNYEFFIASDDGSNLYVSPTDQSTDAERIAYVEGYTGHKQWDKFASQKSASIRLNAGQRYYLAADHSEGAGADHISVAWRSNGGAIEMLNQDVLQAMPALQPNYRPANTQGFVIQSRAEGDNWRTQGRVDANTFEFELKPKFGGNTEVRVLAVNEFRSTASKDRALAEITSAPIKEFDHSGLELYWSFDTPSFHLEDHSGNNRFGAVFNADFTDQQTASGQAIVLDNKADIVETDFHGAQFDAFSVSFWFKPTALNSRNGFYIGSNKFRMYTDSKGQVRIGLNEELRTPEGKGAVVNEWHHFLYSLDEQGNAKLYRDGELVAKRSDLKKPEPWGRFYSREMTAHVDELRIYSRALANNEILHLQEFPAGKTAPEFDNAPVSDAPMTASQLWNQHSCASCHGDSGDGYPGKISIVPSIERGDALALIRDTMPYGNPGACDQDCASALVSWLNTGMQGEGDSTGNNPGMGSETPIYDGELADIGSASNQRLRKLAYKASVNLLGRTPTDSEVNLIDSQGEAGLEQLVDQMLGDESFYGRLRQIYNDRLKVLKYSGNADSQLERFYEEHGPGEGNVQWWRAYSDSKYDGKTDDFARANIRKGVSQEPLRLIDYVVRNNHPFTEVLTADYTLVNYYSARALNLQSGLNFKRLANPEHSALPFDPEHYLPLTIPGLKHAGIVTKPSFMGAHPTTSTNRNRHRARKVYEYFLDVDIFAISGNRPSSEDIAGNNPTMDNPTCVACHSVMDPVASSFKHWQKGIYRVDNLSIRNWATDNILPPGFNGSEMPYGTEAPLTWLMSEIANDPRFATATVKTLFAEITGNSLMAKPANSADPETWALYRMQQTEIGALASRFIQSGHNLKSLVKDLVLGAYFRGEASVGGSARLLRPELLTKKIEQTTGINWGNYLNSNSWYKALYGGAINEVDAERSSEVDGVRAAIQGRMAQEVACQATAPDFGKGKAERLLFPYVEASTELSNANAAAIKQNIQYLHWQFYGESVAIDDPTVERAYQLLLELQGIGFELIESGDVSNQLHGSCRKNVDRYDRNFNQRAWQALVSRMLNDFRYLYE